MKSTDEVVSDFNEIVNMSADELEAFLKTGDSTSTGWSKGDGSGESVGHESGRKIVDILKRNPSKDASKYTEEDKEHMRKVVAYCKRHLAQEGHLKETKGPEELEKSKSTRSLKNWGHDPMKTIKGGSSGKPASKKADKAEKPVSKKAEKPTSKKEDKADKPVSKAKPASKKEEKSEKPVSKAKPASKKENKKEEPKSAKPTSKKAEKPVSKKADAETGEKRAADETKPAEKPASKKAKTDAKPPSEGSRKPPSRSAKKA